MQVFLPCILCSCLQNKELRSEERKQGKKRSIFVLIFTLLQENIIREFNLNEILERCKKLGKGRSEKIEELRSLPREQADGDQPPMEESESKKEK